MRSYLQVRDVLKEVSRRHQELLDNCCEDEELEANDPLTPLLDYLRVHEQAVKNVLDRYAPQEQESVLNTWLQYVPAEQLDDVFSSRDFSKPMTAPEVITMVMEFDNALVELYRSIADNAQTPPRVNEVFHNLLEQQQWQQLRNAWAISESEGFATGQANA